ncbi:hypothetical protein [Paraburkholderia sediminicola]|uniref:hypothetical protein n=1 Tax=Paraburkholderia sediminicola TaxID=458836 RepID=UPI0038BD69B0
MKERPILFNGAMVRALLDGSKTQTRRVVKLPHNNPLGQWEPTTIGGENGGRTLAGATLPLQGGIWHTRTGDSLICPHGQPGDRLWVRESGVINKLLGTVKKPGLFRHDVPTTPEIGHYWVEETRAPGASYNVGGCSRSSALLSYGAKVCPSIHMPRWACRLELEITTVRVERLQDISAADARAEGIEFQEHRIAGDVCRSWKAYGSANGWYPEGVDSAPIFSYRSLWDGLNAERGYGWDINPWVWVVQFARVEP